MESVPRTVRRWLLPLLLLDLCPRPHGVRLQQRPLAVLASHHKTGSDLLVMMLSTNASQQALGSPMALKWDHALTYLGWMGHTILQPEYAEQGLNFSASDARLYRTFDVQALNHIRDSGRDFRLVHLVRDPLQLIVSGYFYHLKFDDTPRMRGTGPTYLRALPQSEGLQVEAAAELNGTIREIVGVLDAAKRDPRVLTVGLEDFEDDFNGTVSCVYSFLLGSEHPGLRQVVEAAQVADKSRWTAAEAEKVDPGHFALPEQRAEALRTVQEDDQHAVWDLVSQARHAFGYKRHAPGKWRYRQRPCAARRG